LTDSVPSPKVTYMNKREQKVFKRISRLLQRDDLSSEAQFMLLRTQFNMLAKDEKGKWDGF